MYTYILLTLNILQVYRAFRAALLSHATPKLNIAINPILEQLLPYRLLKYSLYDLFARKI
jgi:hypothetical protein